MAAGVAGLLISIALNNLFVSPVFSFPEGLLLKVVPHCGNGISDGLIEATGDLPVMVTARCDNGLRTFIKKNDSHSILPISFSENGHASCIMTKLDGGQVYSTTVDITWGESRSNILTNKERFNVTCIFGDGVSEATVEKTAIPRLIAPQELQQHQGPNISSVIKLELVDVMEEPVGRVMRTGKRIRLKATTTGGAGVLGLRAASCDAVGMTTGVRYAVLRAGCGDGIIFEKNDGFQTSGLTSVSPYFKSFRVGKDPDISFSCNFTVCATACNGSSCIWERKKRMSPVQDIKSSMNIQSTTYTVQEISLDQNTTTESTSLEYSNKQPSSEQAPPWALTLVFSILSFLCVIAISLSLYNYILVIGSK